MIYEQQANGTVGEVLERLTKAVADEKFGILGQIDLGGKLREKGVEFGPACWVVEVCNPMQAKQVLDAEIRLANLLPCRIAVYEKDGQLLVGTIRPIRLIQMLGTEALVRIIDSACKSE